MTCPKGTSRAVDVARALALAGDAVYFPCTLIPVPPAYMSGESDVPSTVTRGRGVTCNAWGAVRALRVSTGGTQGMQAARRALTEAVSKPETWRAHCAVYHV